jgi:hypothetical protein
VRTCWEATRRARRHIIPPSISSCADNDDAGYDGGIRSGGGGRNMDGHYRHRKSRNEGRDDSSLHHIRQKTNHNRDTARQSYKGRQRQNLTERLQGWLTAQCRAQGLLQSSHK